MFFVDIGGEINRRGERGHYIQDLNVYCRGKTHELGEERHLFADVNQRHGLVMCIGDVKDSLKVLLLRIEQGRKRTGKKENREEREQGKRTSAS